MPQGDDESIDGELLKSAYTVTLAPFDIYTFSLVTMHLTVGWLQCEKWFQWLVLYLKEA